jgi:hypothetical protein
MKSVKSFGAFAFVVLLIAAPAFAGPAPRQSPDVPAPGPSSAADSQKKIDPAKETDIRQLLELMGVKSMTNQMVTSLSTTLRPLMINSLPPGDYRVKLVDLWMERFPTKLDAQQMVDAAVPLHDKYFTGDEIKALVAFYKTPVGQKAVSMAPKISADMQGQGMKLGQDAGRQAMSEVLAENPDLAEALKSARAQQSAARVQAHP